MSEMSEVRSDDLERDGTMGDVRQGDAMGDSRRDARGDVQQGDAMRPVGGETTTDDVRGRGQGPAGADGTLTTDQIANPGAAQTSAPTGAGGAETSESDAAQLLDPADREAMTQRWRDIQADFVDQPRKAMQDADALVAGLMQQLAQMFSQERSQLEAQWSRGDQVSTEDLRVSLQRYRAFFERLLSV
jgi:hypothetical protein